MWAYRSVFCQRPTAKLRGYILDKTFIINLLNTILCQYEVLILWHCFHIAIAAIVQAFAFDGIPSIVNKLVHISIT